MFHVAKMTAGDFPFAVQLANTMNWNMAIVDFEFMTDLEPDGCFVLFNGPEPSGIVTSVSFGKVGWFGNLVVEEKCRKRGAGSLLVRHVIAYLKRKGAETIGLYAYPHLTGFYESFGFAPDEDFLVLHGAAPSSAAEDGVKAAKKQDVPSLIDFDREHFGAERKKLLSSILLDADNVSYISTIPDEITGYVTAKVYGKLAEVGPLICQSEHGDTAVTLLKTALNRLRGLEVFIYVPKKENAILALLTKAGFKEDFRVVRMFLGSPIAKNCIYLAESLERG